MGLQHCRAFAYHRNLKIAFKSLILYRAASEGLEGGELGLLYFVVPVDPGRSRLFSLPLATGPRFRTLAAVLLRLPWLRHLYNHTVISQDAVLLRGQAANMAAADFPAAWRRAFFLPTASDGGTAALRRWLEGRGGGDVAWGWRLCLSVCAGT